ncbi:MAG: hypothetical protein EAZ36_00910 [Verrucomicrobia bacterium]|nr:MAG: hypothetical protein EAZ36_00910 [Verrucomicrobiota bacterium]
MINITHIKLQWGTALQREAEWRFGLFGIQERKSGGRSYGLIVSLRGVMLWGLAVALAGYFAAAGYVWWRLAQRPYNFVSYGDLILYPIRKEKVERLRGQAAIEEGFEEVKKGNLFAGIMLIRLGLEKAPRDLRARLEVAQFFLDMRQRLRGRDTLLKGLDFGYPGRTYLDSAVNVARAGEDHEMIIDLCRRALDLHTAGVHPEGDRVWMIETLIRALLAEEQSDEALSFLAQHTSALTPASASELRINALLQAKRGDEAIAVAEAWREVARRDDQLLVRRLQARAYQEAGRVDDMIRVLRELFVLDPADPELRVFAMVQYLASGMESEVQVMLDDYLFRFGGDPDNLLSLAEALAASSRRLEFERVETELNRQGIRDIRLLFAKIELLVAERNWTEAGAQLEFIRSVLPPELRARATLLDFLNVLFSAAATPVEGEQATLLDYVAVRQFPMSLYRHAIKVLRSSERDRTAHGIARLASLLYPENRYLIQTMADIEPQLRAAREADAASRVTRELPPMFATAEAFHEELARVVETSGVEAALSLFRELRAIRPPWFEADNERLDRREMELRAELSDPVLLQASVRLYINSDQMRIDQVVELAKRLYAADRALDARIALDEILRRVPNEPTAAALRLEWFPPPPPEPEPTAEPTPTDVPAGEAAPAQPEPPAP